MVGRIGAGLALVAAVVLLATSVAGLRAVPGTDVVVPAAVPSAPGALVSAERLTSGFAAGPAG